jgi:hypothetical protein
LGGGHSTLQWREPQQLGGMPLGRADHWEGRCRGSGKYSNPWWAGGGGGGCYEAWCACKVVWMWGATNGVLTGMDACLQL